MLNSEVIEEQGIVVKKLANGRIQIVVKRSDACNRCPSKGACMMLAESKEMLVEAHDQAGAEVGQRVVLSQASTVILKASFTAYILPIVGLIVGVFIGKELSGLFAMNPDLLMPLLGLAGTGLVYYLIARKTFSSSYLPTATRIVPSE
jgi:sigma-E factor negative regulatory protein RseC